MNGFKTTIGVEIHVQLATKSKMFCACDNNSRDVEPNTNICPICLGYPGSLPTVNKRAIDFAIMLGLALNAKITPHSKFDRKNYFYPDLPKGYQISQFDLPIVGEGEVEILVDGKLTKVGIERAHLEEDAAKLIHPPGADYSLVDYNRGGTPLVEIVSKPDMHSAAEARRYLAEIYNVATLLGICEGNMEEGNFKFDLNVSVSKTEELGTKVELKNLNSFRNAERALNYEIKRQIELLESDGTIDQETRGWNDATSKTVSQRGKEQAHDYRYFPEPDIPPLQISDKMIADAKNSMPKLPIEIRRELMELGVAADDQDLLIGQVDTLRIFEEAVADLKVPELVKKTVNWLVGDFQPLRANGDAKLTGANIAKLVNAVADDSISSKTAKEIFPQVAGGKSPTEIIAEQGHVQISDDSELEKIVAEVIAANPQAKADFLAGRERSLGFLVGAVMAKTKGQANPSKVNALMRKLLVQ